MTLQNYNKNINTTINKLKKLPLHKLDNQTKQLRKAFDIAYNNGVFKIYDIEPEGQVEARYTLFTKLTKYSGSLTFLAIQILAANNFMISANFPLKEHYFLKKCGISINHLRAPLTVISADKCEGGYKLNATLTWSSGYDIFDALLIGFHYDGYEYTAMAEFKNSKGFKIGEPAESFVGNAMATVNIELKEFFVPQEHLVTSVPIGSYTKGKSISKTVHIAIYSLGLGAIEELKDKEFKQKASVKLEELKDKFMQTNDGREMDKIRIDLFKLVQNITTTGMILNGGSSILADKNLQRYYRELIMFNSNGLNDTIKGLFKEDF